MPNVQSKIETSTMVASGVLIEVTVKRFITIGIIFIMIIGCAPSTTTLSATQRELYSGEYQEGFADGVADGRNTNQSSYFIRGTIGGFLFNFIGGGIAIIGANSDEVFVADSMIPAGTPDYRNGFADAYEKSVKSERANNAWTGAMIGTAVNLIVLSIIGYHALKN